MRAARYLAKFSLPAVSVLSMASPPSTLDLIEEIRGRLARVVDPELGRNIVELGMVGDITVSPEGAAKIEIALTTAACPLRGQIENDVHRAIERLDGISSVSLSMVAMDPVAKAALMDTARRFAQEEAPLTTIPPHARILGISSGKGGVGKSSVTVNLAITLARLGHCVGILDADIWGFSVPRLLGLDGGVEAKAGKMQPRELAVERGSLKVLSMGFLAEEDTAIMWRGLLLSKALQQFIEDADWGDIDYLLIDLPPGTGDIQMGLARLLPRTELLLVTTPPLAAQKVAARAADMARRGNLRVAGVIENMSTFTCAHGESYALFGEGGGQRLADDLGVDLLGSIPLDPSLVAGGDAGTPIATGDSATALRFQELAQLLTDSVAPLGARGGCSARMLDALDRAVALSERASN